MTVLVYGESSRAVFGVRSDEHLRRQWEEARKPLLLFPGHRPLSLLARADVTATNETLAWLIDRPGTCLTDAEGRPLLMVVAEERKAPATRPGEGEWRADGATTVRNGSSVFYSQKLRRHEPVEALDLRRLSLATAERRLFDLVYKGVTDAITRYVWPTPAFHAVRHLSAWRVSPNAVTTVGLLLTIVAAIEFKQAEWIGGLIAAWIMTFLDTVDGKLARVTGTSSRLGDILDHGNDYLHPPVWWLCIVVGAAAEGSMVSSDVLWASGWTILGMYLVGRLAENVFKWSFTFNQYVWTPLDGTLRLIVARRNIILAIVTVGALLGDVGLALVASAAWSVVSIGFQSFRTVWAYVLRASGRPVNSWLKESAPRLVGNVTPEIPPRAAGEDPRSPDEVRVSA
ncbi:MAG TPA: CDP-alcohol phosphatidyltransferase family protein [Nevskiaceae bacterium]|nr:CDP-alcohol phosphatidyltransferase family protein [Nevskiaceae bacterium]